MEIKKYSYWSHIENICNWSFAHLIENATSHHSVILNLSIGPFMTHFLNHKMEQRKYCSYSICNQPTKAKRLVLVEKYASNTLCETGERYQ